VHGDASLSHFHRVFIDSIDFGYQVKKDHPAPVVTRSHADLSKGSYLSTPLASSALALLMMFWCQVLRIPNRFLECLSRPMMKSRGVFIKLKQIMQHKHTTSSRVLFSTETKGRDFLLSFGMGGRKHWYFAAHAKEPYFTN